MTYYRIRLQAEFQKRKEKNPSYSLRAFAKSINIDAGLLSKIFSQKKEMSLSTAKRILESIQIDDLEKKQFIDSIFEEKKQRFQL